MKVNPIINPLPGERVAAVFPPLVPFGERRWRRRLNLYTGRALSDVALQTEQEERAGRLATSGQMFSPGVVFGLEAGVERGVTSDGVPDVRIHITAGMALTASGEDVVAPKAIEVKLNDLPLYPSAELLARLNVADLKLSENSLGALSNRLTLPAVAVLLLRPVTVDSIGNFDPQDPCEIDPQNDAFSDKQIADGCQLTLYLWSGDWRPLPALGPAWRNRIAYTIFNAELANGPDDLAPWEEAGAPIALMGFNSEWAPEFIDRYSVVRAGGKPKRRTALAPNSGSRFLWQSRIQQFAEQMAQTNFTPEQIGELRSAFAFAPPFGLLPKGAVPLARRRRNELPVNLDTFFPPTFNLEASPVPVEELDAALSATAAMAPFDLGAGARAEGGTELARLLVPVPGSVYDPDLLFVEEISPEFEAKLKEFIATRNNWLKRRQVVREKAGALFHGIAGEELKFPDPDPEAIVDEPPAQQLPSPDPPEESFGVTGSGATVAVDEFKRLWDKFTDPGASLFIRFEMRKLEELRRLIYHAGETIDAKNSAPNIVPPDPDAAKLMGVEDFIDLLNRKVKYAEDRIDVAFTRSQTDIYRVRQLVLGVETATRLATSPTLAAIAQGQTAAATRDDIEKFVENSKTQIKFEIEQPSSPSVAGGPVPGAIESIEMEPAPSRTLSLLANLTGDVFSAGNIGVSRPITSTGGFQIPKPITPLPIQKGTLTGSEVAQVIDDKGLFAKPLDSSIFGGKTQVTPTEITDQASIVGRTLDFRTVTISDRIIQPAAPEAKDYSVSNKHDVIREFLEPADKEMALFLDDLQIPGFYEYEAADRVKLQPVESFTVDTRDGTRTKRRVVKSIPIETKLSFGAIREQKLLPKILLGHHDFDPNDGDEGAFFGNSVRAIDHTVSILRTIEGRVKAYKNFILACQATLDKLRASLDQVSVRLQTIGNELAESRHDVSVATALRDEELARIAAINQRRDEILNQHVTFLAFCRARTAATSIGAPSRPLDPGLREAPVPACLNHETRTPPELRRMVDFLREAPVRWLPKLRPLLDRLDDVASLSATMRSAQLRAQIQFPLKQLSETGPQGFFGAALGKVFAAQQSAVALVRAQTAQLDLSVQIESNWRLMRDRVMDFAAVADLIEAAHGRSEVARLSAGELDQIARIAGCLYEKFGEVPARARLRWAEQISQFDAPVNLRNLASLTGWGGPWSQDNRDETRQLERLARRDMQSLVDWLYQRADPQLIEAVGIISDLVRVCILLASHAPVNQIIAGHVPKPAIVGKNSLVELAADLSKVKIGMQVLMFNKQSQVVARGVVEDLGAGRAAARVIHTAQESVSLEQNARVQFTALKLLPS